MLTVILAGQVITGGSISFTVTVKLQVAVLFAASLTVYVTVVTPTLKIRVPTTLMPVAGDVPVVAPVSAHVCTVTKQLSAAVGFGVATDALHNPTVAFTEILAGQVIVGGCTSFTVTVKVQVEASQLPEKQRDAIRLVKLEDRSVREAADITGYSESDIKISIHRGLKTLMRLMAGATA